jgi:type IV pilus assembly protein PilQ
MTLKRCVRIIALGLVVLLNSSVCSASTEVQTVVPDDAAAMQASSYTINEIRADRSGGEFTLHILCSALPTYTMYELFEPLRLVLDFADAAFDKSVVLPLDFEDGPIALIQGTTLADKEPAIVRLEMLIAEQRSYSVEREGNDIVISFPNKATAVTNVEVEKGQSETRVLIQTDGAVSEYFKEELPSEDEQPARMYIDLPNVAFTAPSREITVGTTLERIRIGHRNGVRVVFDSGLGDDLFSYTIAPTSAGLEVVIKEAQTQLLESGNKKRTAQASPAPEKKSGAEAPEAMEPEASHSAAKPQNTAVAQTASQPTGTHGPAGGGTVFPGYAKQPITVDFYKIDLHNVFRLFGEISGLNIVVDEGVGGSLTLSLNNVPWDFALDIILNLKDLQKEERFNTLVISPKSKSFTWPERQLDSLAVSADGTPTTVETLTVQEKIETPPEIMEAKKFMKMGRAAEKAGDYAAALEQYEQAYSLWPENGQLARRMASLYLAREGMNAKAVYFAKAALNIDENDHYAALYAAIGLANMKKINAAKEYFERAVSEDNGVKPPSEALTSYAVFNEEIGNYMEALLLLARHEQLYGDSLETMVAKARIYDKEGNEQKALAEYRAILLSGFELPPDLDRFIKGRLAMNTTR